MYRRRPFELVMVSTNYPDEQTGVLTALKKRHASNPNLLFGAPDTYGLMAAFDPGWNGAVPYIMLETTFLYASLRFRTTPRNWAASQKTRRFFLAVFLSDE